MQKNRTALVAGILALALVMGGIAVYRNQQAQKEPVAAANANADDDLNTNVGHMPTDNGSTVKTDDKTNQTTTNTTTNNNTRTTTSTTIPETHTVKQNETLRDIAKHYYGDPVYSGDIERVNELPDPNNIPVGKVLKLPRPEELNGTPAPVSAAPGTDKKGDAGGTTETKTDNKAEQHNDTHMDPLPGN